jgi:hypothetical protein
MFEPSGEIGKKDSRKLNRRPIEIRLKENHFVALLRRAEVNEPWEAEVVVEEPESETKVIQVKRKKYFRPYDGKFVENAVTGVSEPHVRRYIWTQNNREISKQVYRIRICFINT